MYCLIILSGLIDMGFSIFFIQFTFFFSDPPLRSMREELLSPHLLPRDSSSITANLSSILDLQTQ